MVQILRSCPFSHAPHAVAIMYAPIDNVYSELRCHCITFYSASETAPCALTDSQYLDWEDAQTLASAYDLRIKFASSSTVSKVLEVEQPLPTGVLKSMTRVDDRSSTGRMMVCGFGDEVNQKYMSGSDGSLEVNGYDLFASKVVAVLLLIIILYAAGEFVWMK